MNAPLISPGYSIFDSAPQAVTITSDNPAATIYYSTDGSEPSPASTVYSGAFQIFASSLVKAIAVDGVDTSPTATVQILIDPTTSDVPRNGLTAWLRSDAGIILASSAVQTWMDISGSSNSATQSNASKRPVYTTNAINGQPAVTFSGTGQWLQFPSGFADFTDGLSLFIVLKPTGIAQSDARVIDFGTGTSANSICLREPSTGGITFSVSNSSQNFSDCKSLNFTLNSYQLLEVIHETTIGRLITDSSQTGMNPSMWSIANVTRTANFIGRVTYTDSLYFKGDIVELLLFSRDLTDEERHAVEIYIGSRYALPCIPAPTIAPEFGIFQSATEVSISFDDDDFDLFYTTDGSQPDENSNSYSAPFDVEQTTLIRAIAIAGDGRTSNIGNQQVIVEPASSAVVQEGLLVWLRSDTGVLQDSAGVYQWTDLSGNDLHASQLILTKQPTVSTNAINGQPALTFSGSGQWLQFPSGFADFTAGFSLFIVLKPTGITQASARVIDFGTTSTSANSICLSEPSTGRITFSVSNSAGYFSDCTSPNFALNSYQLLEAMHETAFGRVITDSSQTGINPSMWSIANVTRTGNYIGRWSYSDSFYFKGDIVELILFDRIPSDEERHAIEIYIASRLQIPAIPAPVISPYYGVFQSPTEVTISFDDPDFDLFFTTDGSQPDENSNEYSEPFELDTTSLIRAIAISGDGRTSNIASQVVIVEPTSAVVTDEEPLLWLRSDTGVLIDSFGVYQWKDLSGNDLNASQLTLANQPTYVFNQSLGRQAIAFSGSAQWLQLPSGFANFTEGLSIFIILIPSGLMQTDARIIEFGTGSGYLSSFSLTQPTLGLLAFNTVNTSGSMTSLLTNQFMQNQPQVIAALLDGVPTPPANTSQGKIFTNGKRSGSNPAMNPIPNTTRTSNFIGRYTSSSSWFLKGQVLEFILFDKVLSDEARQAIESYLMDRARFSSLPPPPVLSLPSGRLAQPSSLAICGLERASVVVFTRDGSKPQPSSSPYTGPIDITYSQTIRAIQIIDGLPSTEASAAYVLDDSIYPPPDDSDAEPPGITLNLPSVGQ